MCSRPLAISVKVDLILMRFDVSSFHSDGIGEFHSFTHSFTHFIYLYTHTRTSPNDIASRLSRKHSY